MGPRRCIADQELRLYRYTAMDEFTRLRFLAAYPEPSTYSSADFLKKLSQWYARRGIRVECVQTDNGFAFTNRFSNSKRDLPTLFGKTAGELGIRHKLIRPDTPATMGRSGAATGKTRNAFTPAAASIPSTTLQSSLRPQPPLQQLPHEAPRLAFPL